MDEKELETFFGMTESKAKETAKNVTLSKYLKEAVVEVWLV